METYQHSHTRTQHSISTLTWEAFVGSFKGQGYTQFLDEVYHPLAPSRFSSTELDSFRMTFTATAPTFLLAESQW